MKRKNEVVAETEGRESLSKRLASKIGDYQGFDVVFASPVTLEANTMYLQAPLPGMLNIPG